MILVFALFCLLFLFVGLAGSVAMIFHPRARVKVVPVPDPGPRYIRPFGIAGVVLFGGLLVLVLIKLVSE